MSCSHMTYKILNLFLTHENDGIRFMVKVINLPNLDDKLEPSRYLTY